MRSPNPAARCSIDVLVAILEAQAGEIALVKETNQQLRDEVARLQGEQGKPTIRAQPTRRDHSTEQERPAERRASGQRAARRPVVVDREELCQVEKSVLPADAQYKGLEPFVVQEVVLGTDTVR